MYEVMKTTIPPPFVETNDEGWKRVLDGKEEYAFLLESTVNEYLNQQKPCKTMKVGNNLNQNGYGIATRKGSAIRYVYLIISSFKRFKAKKQNIIYCD